jgi:hypothetical protein
MINPAPLHSPVRIGYSKVEAEDMTRTLSAHFDGKVIVPDDPVDLPVNRKLTITVSPGETERGATPRGTAGFLLKEFQGHGITDHDAELMKSAIEDACERIETDAAVDFDEADRGHERGDRSD